MAAAAVAREGGDGSAAVTSPSVVAFSMVTVPAGRVAPTVSALLMVAAASAALAVVTSPSVVAFSMVTVPADRWILYR